MELPQSPQDQEAMKEIARLIAEKDRAVGGMDKPAGAAAAEGSAVAGPEAPTVHAPPSQALLDAATVNALDNSLLIRLIENIPAAIAILADGKLIRANESFALAFGFKSIAELMAAGGLVRLFSSVNADLFSADGKAAVRKAPCDPGSTDATSRRIELQARTKSGRKIDVPLVIHQIGTEPSGVMLLVLHPLDSTGSEAAPIGGPSPVHGQDHDQNLGEPLGEYIGRDPRAGADSTTPAGAVHPESSASWRPPTPGAHLESPAGAIDLLAKVSHEVRTPLNSIIGFAEMMEQEQFGPLGHAKYAGYARDIVESGQYALGIINDLLDLTKIQSGHFELNFTAVDVNDVIRDCVHLIEAQARTDRVVLRLALADGLPPVLADRRSLKQILLNLLSNAVKFTEPSGQVIVSSSRESAGGVLLRVRDTGVGMSSFDIAQALKPFQQLETTPRRRTGTGLGLPLTRAFVHANRAEMAIDSARGVGTSIDITFPPQRVSRA